MHEVYKVFAEILARISKHCGKSYVYRSILDQIVHRFMNIARGASN